MTAPAAASHCSYRHTRPADLARCVELFRADGVRGALLDEALLAQWLEAGAFISCVFEEHVPGGAPLIRGCGFSAFAAAETARRAQRGEIPYLMDTLLRSRSAPVPLLLDRRQRARHNAEGEMHLMALNFAIDNAPGAPVAAIAAVCNKAFLESHDGHGLRSSTMEVSAHERKAPLHHQSAHAIGCLPVAMPAGAATQLYVLERGMFDAHPFHPMRMLFVRRQPRIGLTFAQQELLLLALHGHTDEEAAAELGIGWNTVRKRWAAIFEQVDKALPGLLGGGPAGAAPDNGGNPPRGTEKRRPLLSFLAENPQELRPWATAP